MSAGYRFQRDLAAAVGERSSALARPFAELLKAGLTENGPWQVEPIYRGILCLAATRPNRTVETVKSLELLPFSEALPTEKKPPAQSLGLALCRMIEGTAQPLILGQELSPDYEAMIASWGLDLCPELHEAQISWNTNVRRLSFIYSRPGPKQAPGMWRVTHISGAVLLTAAKHLADTIINENAAAAVQALDRAKINKKSAQERKNADNLPPKVPAFLDYQAED